MCKYNNCIKKTEIAMRLLSVKPNKERFELYFKRGLRLQQNGETEQAKRCYALASLDDDAMIPQAAYNLARIYQTQNNAIKAKEYFHIAFQRGLPKAAYYLGCIYKTEKNIEKAEKCYKLAADQNIPEASYALGCIYEKLKNEPLTALAHFKKATIDGYPDKTSVHNKIANIEIAEAIKYMTSPK